MKILLITQEFPPIGAGVSTVVYNLSKYMIKQGHNISMLTCQFGKTYPNNIDNKINITKFDTLTQGKGPFAELGEEIFDDYWTYYLTKDMARALELRTTPYKNLPEYKEYKKLKIEK